MRWRDDLLIAGTAVSLGLAALLVYGALSIVAGSDATARLAPLNYRERLARPVAGAAS